MPIHLTDEAHAQHKVLDFDPHEGARHVSDLLGMHIKHPEELQRAEREAEVAHRYMHHPVTRYDPDHFVEHDHHHEFIVHDEPIEGLPVHNRYGERVIEHDPYHQEYVHGTNYELIGAHSEPVIEHNPHAFPSKFDKYSIDAKKQQAPKKTDKKAEKKPEKESGKKAKAAGAAPKTP